MTNKEFGDNDQLITLTTEYDSKSGQVWKARKYSDDVFYRVYRFCI